MGKVATETTLQELLSVAKSIAKFSADKSTWNALVNIGQSGNADSVLGIGDIITDTYTVDNDHVYDNIWVVVDFRDVIAYVNGIWVTYKNAPILQMLYTTHESIAFDPREREVATEATALANTYYVGTNDNDTFTMIAYNEGDTINYAAYTYIYHSTWNSTYPAHYGANAWALSFARQYLNNEGTSYAVKQHTYDVLPGTISKGFKSLVSSDMINALHPIKVTTVRPSYMSGVDVSGTDDTYDTTTNTDVTKDMFWLLSVADLNVYHSNASANDGTPMAYYKELLGVNASRTDGKQPQGTYAQLIKYAINAKTTAQYQWLRSANLGNNNEWNVNTSGNVNNNNPNNTNRFAPDWET